ncbi:putative cutinase [Microsporum ferrugineum]
MKLELFFLLSLVACAIAAPNRAREVGSPVTIRSDTISPGNRPRQWWEYEGEGENAQSASNLILQAVGRLNEILRHQQEMNIETESTDEEGLVENGILDHAPCQPLTMIFARGTNEGGNMGKVIGRPLAAALRAQTGNKVIIQGVNYEATPEGNLLLGLNGGPIMSQLVGKSLEQCPDSKVVLAGYSQGAMVTHAAAVLTPKGVSALAVFGDPGRFAPFVNISPDKTKKYCLPGDPVCLNGFDLDAHSKYGIVADDAAKFLIKAAGAQ